MSNRQLRREKKKDLEREKSGQMVRDDENQVGSNLVAVDGTVRKVRYY